MDNNHGYIRARIKTQGQIARTYTSAVYWGKPLDDEHWCHGADEVILPFLGKTIEVRKKRMCFSEFYFEIKDSGGLVVIPEWIKHFESDMLVPPAEYNDPNYPHVHDDTWLDYSESRFMMIDEICIVTG